MFWFLEGRGFLWVFWEILWKLWILRKFIGIFW
jgi:hypothetical protein